MGGGGWGFELICLRPTFVSKSLVSISKSAASVGGLVGRGGVWLMGLNKDAERGLYPLGLIAELFATLLVRTECVLRRPCMCIKLLFCCRGIAMFAFWAVPMIDNGGLTVVGSGGENRVVYDSRGLRSGNCGDNSDIGGWANVGMETTRFSCLTRKRSARSKALRFWSIFFWAFALKVLRSLSSCAIRTLLEGSNQSTYFGGAM